MDFPRHSAAFTVAADVGVFPELCQAALQSVSH